MTLTLPRLTFMLDTASPFSIASLDAFVLPYLSFVRHFHWDDPLPSGESPLTT